MFFCLPVCSFFVFAWSDEETKLPVSVCYCVGIQIVLADVSCAGNMWSWKNDLWTNPTLPSLSRLDFADQPGHHQTWILIEPLLFWFLLRSPKTNRAALPQMQTKSIIGKWNWTAFVNYLTAVQALLRFPSFFLVLSDLSTVIWKELECCVKLDIHTSPRATWWDDHM